MRLYYTIGVQVPWITTNRCGLKINSNPKLDTVGCHSIYFPTLLNLEIKDVSAKDHQQADVLPAHAQTPPIIQLARLPQTLQIIAKKKTVSPTIYESREYRENISTTTSNTKYTHHRIVAINTIVFVGYYRNTAHIAHTLCCWCASSCVSSSPSASNSMPTTTTRKSTGTTLYANTHTLIHSHIRVLSNP